MTHANTHTAFANQQGIPLMGIAEKPILLPVIHTEEEFPWDKPFSRENRSTSHTPAIIDAHRIFKASGLKPVYMVTDPIARDEKAVEMLSRWLSDGDASVGTHLHPWLVEPFDDEVNNRNSYPGNLPPDLEAEKLAVLTKTVGDAFGVKPIAYLAGRYGLGPDTARTLADLGYKIDFSPSPTYDFSNQEGPDFSRWLSNASFNTASPDILHIPHACGYAGAFATAARPNAIARFLKQSGGLSARLLSALKLLQHGRISPEGMPLTFMKKLTLQLIDAGVSTITLSFHSPSLVPGHTSYVQTEAARLDFIDTLDQFCYWFTTELGGKGADLETIYQSAKQQSHQAKQAAYA